VPSSAKILVVDDDPSILEGLRAALAPRYELVCVQTGIAALEMLSQQPPDLILLDTVLPDISGLTIVRILQRISPTVSVILMTGFGSEDVAVEALRGGVRDYLKKPFSLPDLLDRVEAVLMLRQGLDESTPGVGHGLKAPWPAAGQLPCDASLQRAVAFIEAHLHAPLSLDQVSREAGMSKFHFCRRFKECIGLTFREFLTRRRIARAIELFQDRNRSVTDVYLDVGFKDISHFARVFRRVTGQCPSYFRMANIAPTGDRTKGAGHRHQFLVRNSHWAHCRRRGGLVLQGAVTPNGRCDHDR